MTEPSLAQRILSAADAVEVVAEMQGAMHPDITAYSARELRGFVKMMSGERER